MTKVKHAGLYISLLILAMDIVAGILGLEAEHAENKALHMKVLKIFECREPSHRAYKLGLAAASILALAHVIANLWGGCLCICSKGEFERASANRQLTVLFLIISWIILAVGFSLLLIGAMDNSKSKGSCGLSHHRFLGIGGILCFIHGIFISGYCISANATKIEEKHADKHNTSGA